MKAMITIPIEIYRTLERCGDNRPEYRILKSGVIEESGAHVVIRCDTQQALQLCAWANDRASGAARRIMVVPETGPGA